MKKEDPYNQTYVKIRGQPPWLHVFKKLRPWTFIDIRVRFGNQYGVGKPSEWVYGHSAVASKDSLLPGHLIIFIDRLSGPSNGIFKTHYLNIYSQAS